jgi:RNA polymerase sigma-70 factor (ECF subfamily)
LPEKIDLDQLVDNHSDYLFRYALVKVRDESLAEDLVQETYLAAVKSLESYEGRSTERTWLTAILKYKIADYYRKYSKETAFDITDLERLETEKFFTNDGKIINWSKQFRPAHWSISPYKSLENREFYEVLERCLKDLPDKIESVFRLREMDGFDSTEIQKAFHLSPGNYWVMMHRARLSLRRCMEVNWFNAELG